MMELAALSEKRAVNSVARSRWQALRAVARPRVEDTDFSKPQEDPTPRPLPPPPPHIELAGSGKKDDYTLRGVPSLTRDVDTIKKREGSYGFFDDVT